MEQDKRNAVSKKNSLSKNCKISLLKLSSLLFHSQEASSSTDGYTISRNRKEKSLCKKTVHQARTTSGKGVDRRKVSKQKEPGRKVESVSRTKESGGYREERERSSSSQRVALYPRVVKQLVKRAPEMRSVSSGSDPIYTANL